MKDNRLATIYRICCRVTGKSYIGSTKSVVSHRWTRHIWQLNNNRQKGLFQDDWNRYGPTEWDFSMLEVAIPPEKQYRREQYWIDKYTPTDNYNKSPFASRLNKYNRIVLLLKAGHTYREIYKMTGVTLGTISAVKNRYLF
jgi:group I intron endonuclease